MLSPSHFPRGVEGHPPLPALPLCRLALGSELHPDRKRHPAGPDNERAGPAGPGCKCMVRKSDLAGPEPGHKCNPAVPCRAWTQVRAGRPWRAKGQALP